MNNPLADKSFAFSCRILDMCDYFYSHATIPNTRHLPYSLEVVVKQVTRSGTSIGANIAEGEAAQSTSDLLSKHYIALKESYETHYWLNILLQRNHLTAETHTSMSEDLAELLKMLTASIKTLKSKTKQ